MTPNQVVVLASLGDRRWHTVNDLCAETGYPYTFVRGCLGNFRLVGWVTAGKGTWKITSGGVAQLERPARRSQR